MRDHLVPCSRTAATMSWSSSLLQSPFFTEGARWLNHRSRHCRPMRPGRYAATFVQCPWPCSAMMRESIRSSSAVHAFFFECPVRPASKPPASSASTWCRPSAEVGGVSWLSSSGSPEVPAMVAAAMTTGGGCGDACTAGAMAAIITAGTAAEVPSRASSDMPSDGYDGFRGPVFLSTGKHGTYDAMTFFLPCVVRGGGFRGGVAGRKC